MVMERRRSFVVTSILRLPPLEVARTLEIRRPLVADAIIQDIQML